MCLRSGNHARLGSGRSKHLRSASMSDLIVTGLATTPDRRALGLAKALDPSYLGMPYPSLTQAVWV